jgi:hypothetical protein
VTNVSSRIFGRTLFASLSALAFATLAPTPAAAQSLSPELKALDEQLPGELVSDPSRIDWDSYGPDFYAESVVDESIPGGGAARRFHVNRATEFIYTSGTNIPLIRDVERGDVVTIGFWARTVEASTPDGKGVVRVRFQQDAPPYPGFGEKTLEIGTEWDWYEVTAPVEQKLRRKDGIVAIQFGRTKQILEIGQAIVVSGASTIEGTPVPAPAPAALAPTVENLIPPPLAGQGKLLNDPRSREWAITAVAGSSEPRDEPGIWLGKATKLVSTAGSANGSGVTARIPIGEALAEGDEFQIAIAARTVSAATPTGRAMVGISVEHGEGTKSRFAQNRMEVGPNWQLIRVKTRAPSAVAAGTGEVVIELGEMEQALDVGPVYVLKPH